jgi:hypothetical protein
MLGRGETLPAGCTLTEGEIDRAVVRAVYACGAERVGLELMHPSKAPDAGLRTEKFAGTVVEGSPPAELLAALTARMRTEEAGFTWLLEAGPQTSRPVADVGPYGYYLPVLTSREVLLRMVGGAAVLLVLTPWWAAGARRPDARGGRDPR